jgi:hypothetical protein
MDYNLTNEINPKLNAFDLSHNHFTTMEMGKLYPVAWLECVPGDIIRLDTQALVRVQPMVAPILNNLTCDLQAFFVPTRLLWKDWENFITTIEQGTIPPKNYVGTPPVWCESDTQPDAALADVDVSPHSLWDMFGFSRKFNTKALKEFRPSDFLRRAYYFIWNEWFRDENLQEPIDYYNSVKQDLCYRAWKKDYYTAAYYSRQKGTAPAIPLTGTGSVKWTTSYNGILDDLKPMGIKGGLPSTPLYLQKTDSGDQVLSIDGGTGVDAVRSYGTTSVDRNNFLAYLNSNSFDLSSVGTFTVDDMRDMFAIQKFMTKLMMAGSRYIEFLQSQFGVSPSDARLQIPERIGGTSFNIQISEVIATAQTQVGDNINPQGNQSGHGLSVSAGSCGSYKVVEFGYIMILANIQPPAVYTDRLPRSMFRRTLLEQFNPHFVNLSFQSIYNREIYADGSIADSEIFAYAGRYDELRECNSYVSGDLYDKLDYYLNFRKFAGKPSFNSDFIECKPDNNIFKVQDEPPFICNFFFDIKALRPLPLISEPGLIDHVYGGI